MELFAADGHDAGGCERVTGKSGMRPYAPRSQTGARFAWSPAARRRVVQLAPARDDIALTHRPRKRPAGRGGAAIPRYSAGHRGYERQRVTEVLLSYPELNLMNSRIPENLHSDAPPARRVRTRTFHFAVQPYGMAESRSRPARRP